MPPWSANILTLFPDMFPGPLGISLAGRALDKGLWSLEATDIRAFATGRHRAVDDTPAGGGPGMIMRADIAAAAIDHALMNAPGLPLIYLTPRGIPFTEKRALELARGQGAIILCGRFEGLDQRVIEAREMEELSVGDYILSGGEIAAMAVLDAVIRLLPGVIGSADSLTAESFEEDLLEYPQYTRPAEWEGRGIPGVLTSGDHAAVARWRRGQAEKLTRERRPDLWRRRQKHK